MSHSRLGTGTGSSGSGRWSGSSGGLARRQGSTRQMRGGLSLDGVRRRRRRNRRNRVGIIVYGGSKETMENGIRGRGVSETKEVHQRANRQQGGEESKADMFLVRTDGFTCTREIVKVRLAWHGNPNNYTFHGHEGSLSRAGGLTQPRFRNTIGTFSLPNRRTNSHSRTRQPNRIC